MIRKTLNCVVICVVIVLVAVATIPAVASDAETGAERAFEEMRTALGEVPLFLAAFPAAGVEGAWAETKAIQLSPETALSGKVKELIGLAVAAQVPCDYCVYFHTEAAKLHGASDQEIREAIAMAAITRHWSTVLNGSRIDEEEFEAQTDRILAHVRKSAASEPDGGD